MNTIPQPAPLSKHAWLMKRALDLLDDPEKREQLGYPSSDYEIFSPESALVLAALDAFADEQAPAPRGTEEAE